MEFTLKCPNGIEIDEVCDGKKCEWVYSGKDYKKCSICGEEEY